MPWGWWPRWSLRVSPTLMVLGSAARDPQLPELSRGQPSCRQGRLAWAASHQALSAGMGSAQPVSVSSCPHYARFFPMSRWNLLCLGLCLQSPGVTEESASLFFTSFSEIFVGVSENSSLHTEQSQFFWPFLM